MTLFIPPVKTLLSQLGPQRQTITLTATAAKGALSLPGTFEVFRIGTTAPGRFRLYRDEASRDADALRPLTQDPAPGTGVILETLHVEAALLLTLAPIPTGAPALPGTACAWAWEGAAGAVITLEILQVEAA